MAGKKIETFDFSKLDSMVEPLTVRVEKLKGNQRTPIPLPRVAGSDGMQQAPGTGWNRNKILQLEEWIRQTIGGGIYTASVTDSSGSKMDWSFAFSVRENPEKPLPEFPDDATFSEDMVLPQQPFVQQQAAQQIPQLNWAQRPRRYPSSSFDPYSTWRGGESWDPNGSPPSLTSSWSPWRNRSTASSTSSNVSLPTIPASGIPSEDAIKLREQLMKMEHQRDIDRMQTEFARQANDMKDEIRRLSERRQETPDVTKVMNEALGKLVEVIKPITTANSSSEIQRLEERLREKEERFEKERERDRQEQERRERERERLEAERREREKERADLEKQREQDRRDAEKREQALRDEIRRIADSNSTNKPDPYLLLLQSQQDNSKEMMRLQIENMSRMNQNAISPVDLIKIMQDKSSGLDSLSNQITGAYGNIFTTMNQAMQNMMQMSGGESQTMSMLREALHNGKEAFEKKMEAEAEIAVAEAKAKAANARAMEEAARARQAELARQREIQMAQNGGGSASPNAQRSQRAASTAATPTEGNSGGKVINIEEAREKRIHGRTDEEWFGPLLLPHIKRLREETSIYLDAISTNPPKMVEGQIPGASPKDAMRYLMQGLNEYLTKIPNGRDLPIIIVFTQGMFPDLMDVLFPSATQEYRDNCVHELMSIARASMSFEEEEEGLEEAVGMNGEAPSYIERDEEDDGEDNPDGDPSIH